MINNIKYCSWEYATKGKYHKNLDPNWSFVPTYLKKINMLVFFQGNLDRTDTETNPVGKLPME